MSEALHRLGVQRTHLISAVADDLTGRYILDESRKLGLDTSHIRVLSNKKQQHGHSPLSSGFYCGVFTPHGELKIALGDMQAHDHITPEVIEQSAETIRNSSMCVLDANIPIETMEAVCDLCRKYSVPVWYNPTDIRKCNRIVSSLSKVTYISPNSKELVAIFKETVRTETVNQPELAYLLEKYGGEKLEDEIEFDDLKRMLKHLLKYVPFVFFSRGKQDLVLASSTKLDLDAAGQLTLASSHSDPKSPHLYLFPVLRFEDEEANIVNVSGAGDSASSAFIAGIVKGYSVNSVVYYGLRAAMLALQSNHTISPDLAQITLGEVEKLVKENRKSIKIIVL
jgi:sugar/nucleoside kinase (ribokinase family)